jgi:dihydroflavonol-4-reductase
MKVLVIGASGFIGFNLVLELLRRNYSVKAMIRDKTKLDLLRSLPVEPIVGDVLAPETLVSAMDDCECVFHTAAIFTYWQTTPQDLETTAIAGTRNVLNSAKTTGVRRVILTSSSVVFGSSHSTKVIDESCVLQDPYVSPYAKSKALQHSMAREHASEHGIDLVSVCPTITVGAYDRKLVPSNAIIIDYLTDPFKATFPGGCNVVSVKDVALGHILAAERGNSGAEYILGSENLEWSLLHRTISELAGIGGPKFLATHAAAYVAAALQESRASFRKTTPLRTRSQAKMVGRFYWYSLKQAAQLGFEARPSRLALAEAIAWLIQTRHISKNLRRRMRLDADVFHAQRRFEEEQELYALL